LELKVKEPAQYSSLFDDGLWGLTIFFYYAARKSGKVGKSGRKWEIRPSVAFGWPVKRWA